MKTEQISLMIQQKITNYRMSEIGIQQNIRLYRMLGQFVKERNIQLAEFWYSDRLCITNQDFVQMCEIAGFSLQVHKEIEFISLEDLINNIPFWREKQGSISSYLGKNKIQGEKKMMNQKSEENISRSSKMNDSKLYFIRTNRKFLNMHAKKEQQSKLKLNNTLRSVKNQSDYELSMKIGEANDICSKLKNGTLYLIKTIGAGRVEVFKNEKGKEQKKISETQFECQYRKLKQTMMNKVEKIQDSLQQDLKKVMVEVMWLSSEMTKQIHLLEMKGIQH